MARKSKRTEPKPDEKTLWDFAAVVEKAEVFSKEDVSNAIALSRNSQQLRSFGTCVRRGLLRE